MARCQSAGRWKVKLPTESAVIAARVGDGLGVGEGDGVGGDVGDAEESAGGVAEAGGVGAAAWHAATASASETRTQRTRSGYFPSTAGMVKR